MEAAIKAKEAGGCGFLKAAERYNVPKSTLERRVKGKNKIAKGAVRMMGNRKAVLTTEFEKALKDYILSMEEALFGLTYLDVRKMAFELAKRNGLDHNLIKRKGWRATTGYTDSSGEIRSFHFGSLKINHWRDPEALTKRMSINFSKYTRNCVKNTTFHLTSSTIVMRKEFRLYSTSHQE